MNSKIIPRKLRQTIFYIIIAGFVLILINSCKKDDKTTPATETGTVTDIQGYVYKTVKIGNQWWMAENLKVTKFRNGKNILIVGNLDTAKWNNLTTSGCCTYDIVTNAPGLLYNWYAVIDSNNLAPVGWHIPSDEEWKELEITLGMSTTEASKVGWRGTNEGDNLKIEGPEGWVQYGNVWGTNKSGFTALAGGCRMFNGIWSSPYGIGFMGFWWSVSEQSATDAWYRNLDHKTSNVFRYHGPKTYGFSIRCVKDN